MSKTRVIIIVVGLIAFGCLQHSNSKWAAETVFQRSLSVFNETAETNYRLPTQAQAWCQPSTLPPLDYHQCDADGIVYRIPFMAGLTNGLKMLLLTVIGAFEENKCFFVSENPQNRLLFRDDKSQQLQTFLGRYFEPIGLEKDDAIVANARRTNQIVQTNWADYWESAKRRRLHGRRHNITSLGYIDIESTELKRTMLQRMWRLLPDVRDRACAALEMHGIEEEYLAFSVRRGDKDTEGFEFTKSDDYIAAADVARVKYFDGKMPRIFVATDDCAAMDEFRQLRPDWTFVSECDHNNGHSGFVLADMKNWTLEQTDEHYRKFFVELIGLAGAKFYIGVTYTNVAWWAVFMRPHRESHQFLDVPNRNVFHTLNAW